MKSTSAKQPVVRSTLRRPRSRVEGGKWISLLFCMYISFALGLNAVVLIPFEASTGGERENSTFIATWIAMHAIALGYCVTRALNRNFFRFKVGEFVLVTFSGYVILSALWSPDPAKSAPYAAMLAANAVFCYVVARDLPPERFIALLRNTILIMIVASLAAWLIGYQNVIYFDPHDRENLLGLTPIRGFFPHKIMASLYAVLAIVISLYTLSGAIRVAAIGISFVFIALTGSSTGISLLLLAIILFPVLKFVKRTRLPATVFAAIVIIISFPVLALTFGYYGDALEFLGRDPTLTGRTELWAWGLESWLQRPLLGWGYKGYFESADAAGFGGYARFRNYDVPHFHQSLLQTAVDLGIPGALLLLANASAVLLFGYRKITRDSAMFGECLFMLMLILIIASLTMFLFYNYNHPATIFIMYFGFYVIGKKPVTQQAVDKDRI